MKLGYERLAIAGLSAMITTLLITTAARYATEHQNRLVDHTHALPQDWKPTHASTTGP